MSEALVPKIILLLLHFKYYYRRENSGTYLILGAEKHDAFRKTLPALFFGMQYVRGKEVWPATPSLITLKNFNDFILNR